MSPKYEHRRKEFIATFSEFLQTHIRKKYYDFMNDIQAKVNFFEWFDRNYKPKILNEPQRKDKSTHREPRSIIANHKSLTTNTRSIIPNTRPITTNHANQQMVVDNIHFAKKQTPLASQYGQINTINKNNTYKDKKKHKLDKIPIIDPPTKDSREKVTKQNPSLTNVKRLVTIKTAVYLIKTAKVSLPKTILN